MCGLLFIDRKPESRISFTKFKQALERQRWRGPDSEQAIALTNGRFFLGHNRLAIVDPNSRSNQPMLSRNGRYAIIYNGEIYNHLEIRAKLQGEFLTTSDTETVLEGYAQLGESIFSLLDGMFALVILDISNGQWIAARDPLGIKPLCIGVGKDGEVVIGSEAPIVASLTESSPCSIAIEEWRLIRRPIPGATFFSGVEEIQPGTFRRSDGKNETFWDLEPTNAPYEQERFETLLRESVTQHELSDVHNVALLSGGLDSAVICSLSKVSRCYCVGLPNNNEFSDAAETAATLGLELKKVIVTPEMLKEKWIELTRLRGEPLGLPNEGLIYLVCKSMDPFEKVVLTGEGADELLFGYDGIYRWAVSNRWQGAEEFLRIYGYHSTQKPTERLLNYIESIAKGKRAIDVTEDFFYRVHLPGLLRRMDFAAMASSKEARVPFVSKRLISYMYRRASEIKINNTESKIPLRTLAGKLMLQGPLKRKKIGFSANPEIGTSKHKEYAIFQSIVMGALEW